MAELPEVPAITGADEELVNRLILALSLEALSLDALQLLSLELSILLLCETHPHNEDDRTDRLELVRQRLIEHVRLGLLESMLIRAVRDSLDKWVTDQADVGKTAASRQADRDRLERLINDPAELAAFTRDADPDRVRSDDEWRDSLRAIANRIPTPDADHAQLVWTVQEQWRAAKQAYLNDEDLAEWRRLKEARAITGE